MRWCLLLLLCFLASTAFAQDPASPTIIEPSTTLSEEALSNLELGKLLMGQNNPQYAMSPIMLDFDTRNAAGEQAVRAFRTVVSIAPKSAEGWLWLGIALTETRRYAQDYPGGQLIVIQANRVEATNAFRKAYELEPGNLACISYYGEALTAYHRDFLTTRQLWERYLATSTRTDFQRMTALVQIARANLNMAYFGRMEQTLPQKAIQEYFSRAETSLQQAAGICPNADDVKTMQGLIRRYRHILIIK